MNTDLTADGAHHLWVHASGMGPAMPAHLGLPPALAVVNAHRRLRGPYSGGGQLVLGLVAEAIDRWPDLVTRHDVELRAVASELRSAVPCTRETLTSLASPDERTRFYPRARTTRLAHGITEFVMEFVRRAERGPLHLVVENVHRADPTDWELLAIMLRRIHPRLLQIVACSGDGPLPSDLVASLERYATPLSTAVGPSDDSAADQDVSAERYVAGDCTSEEPRLREAYEATAPAVRAALHDTRAAELRALGEPSLALGAVPFHCERGSDPTGAGADALTAALEHCMLDGFYEAVIDLAGRSLAVLDWQEEPERCWLVTAKLTTALSVLERPDEAAQAYDDACAASALPAVHLQSAYGRAMLYTRFFDRDRIDHRRAKAWINTAIAIASLYGERERRAYNLTFQENGLALVEMHLGDLEESLRLVTEGLERLELELGSDKETLHRSVLRYNEAQLLSKLGPLDRALQAYNDVIAADPNHSEYYFERAGLLRRIGNVEGALADYDAAIRLSPPYPEPFYNRADLAVEVGNVDLALQDLSYVLELDPSFLSAYVNRAGLLYELGDLDGAAADVAAGLALDPDNAHLQCTRGLIAQDEGRPTEARRAFDQAIAQDPSLVAAWANRAVLSFEEGCVQAAIDDFTYALGLDDDPTIRANRGFGYQHAGLWNAAIADYTAALGHDDVDGGAVLYRRATCHLHNGAVDLAAADFEACLTAEDLGHSELARKELENLRSAHAAAVVGC